MRIIIILIGLIVLTACGRMDPTFAPYVESFKAAAIEQGRPDKAAFDIDIQFVQNLPNSWENAVCIQNIFDRHIEVLASNWDQASEATREQLIFHELGHCILNRGHLTSLFDTEEPVSIMHPTRIDDLHYTEDYSYYIHELFHP